MFHETPQQHTHTKLTSKQIDDLFIETREYVILNGFDVSTLQKFEEIEQYDPLLGNFGLAWAHHKNEAFRHSESLTGVVATLIETERTDIDTELAIALQTKQIDKQQEILKKRARVYYILSELYYAGIGTYEKNTTLATKYLSDALEYQDQLAISSTSEIVQENHKLQFENDSLKQRIAELDAQLEAQKKQGTEEQISPQDSASLQSSLFKPTPKPTLSGQMEQQHQEAAQQQKAEAKAKAAIGVHAYLRPSP